IPLAGVEVALGTLRLGLSTSARHHSPTCHRDREWLAATASSSSTLAAKAAPLVLTTFLSPKGIEIKVVNESAVDTFLKRSVESLNPLSLLIHHLHACADDIFRRVEVTRF